jgi:hypothetical protein
VTIPAPQDVERFVTKALLEQGFLLPPSKFLLELLSKYEIQPHNISPNIITTISKIVTLCEGHW